jgi:hypothetical protein
METGINHCFHMVNIKKMENHDLIYNKLRKITMFQINMFNQKLWKITILMGKSW